MKKNNPIKKYLNISSLLFALLLSGQTFAQSFYDILTVQTIEITFEESNWDYILDTYYANDNDEKLVGTAIINGEFFDQVAVKYKGNSTYSSNNAKNPLHIYLDEYLNQDYDDYGDIKLSNGKNDPSFVREVLSYEIARKYMDAPKSNYAKVYINGSYYGLFSSSEAINKDFMDRRLDCDKSNTRIKCNPESTFDGNGSSLEYLGTDSFSYYDYYEMKSDYGWQDLIDFTYNITNNPGSVEISVDIDRVIWMMAYNNVLVNLDSYLGPFRQNYYLIKDDNGRILPVVWDMNESIGAFEMINSGGGPPQPGSSDDLIELDPFLRDGDSTYPLINMIYNNDRYKKMYIAHCKTILEENFSNGWYYSKADSLQDLIYSDLNSDPNAFYSMSEFTSNLTSSVGGGPESTIGITGLMDDRVTFLESHYAYQYTQPVISNIATPDEIEPFTTANVTAQITNTNYVYLGYRHSKDEVFTKVQMFDDGAHNDGAASDGVYGVSFEVDESNTHFYIYAENDDAGIFSPVRAEHEYYKISATPAVVISSDVVINELMASNDATVADQDNEFDDWIELYNNTGTDISLNGYYLTDDSLDLMKWPFPDVTIEANNYLIVWADGDLSQVGLHAGFKLSAGGESVYLVNSSLEIVNSVTFTDQTTDIAYARMPNGTGDFNTQPATFGYNNDEVNFVNDYRAVKYNVYPNPFDELLTVELNGSQSSNYVIVDIIGKTVATGVLNVEKSIINTSSLGTGVYFLKTDSDCFKLIKK